MTGNARAKQAGVLVVGITGNVGSGKSTVARFWREERDATVVEADSLGAEAVTLGSETLSRLVERFGQGILLPDSSLDRKEMARIAFSSAKNLRALNSIVHPEIIRRIRAAINKARADRLPVLIVDAALLHELGLEGLVDRLVVLDAPEYLRKDRMLASGKMDKETLENLIDLQLPIPVEKLRSRGHLVIENRGDMEALRKSALEVFDSLAEGK